MESDIRRGRYAGLIFQRVTWSLSGGTLDPAAARVGPTANRDAQRGTDMRHLATAFALGALRRGKQIEQFLGPIDSDRDGLRWIALSPSATGITIYLGEVEDVGTDTFLDVTEFPPLNPDDETWGREIAVLSTPQDAMYLAERELGADPERWVNQGVVCDEYQDFRTARGSNP